MLFTAIGFSQPITDYVSFDIRGNEVYITKLPTCRLDLECVYYEDRDEISTHIISSSTTVIRLSGAADDYNFELYAITRNPDEEVGYTRGPMIGLATMDDIDTKILKTGDYSILGRNCPSNSNNTYVTINGVWFTRACYCTFYGKVISNVYNIPQYNNYIQSQMVTDYIANYLDNRITAFENCDIKGYSNINQANRLANLNSIADIIENEEVKLLSVYEITGKQIFIITKEELSILSAGMYIIKSFENGEIKTHKIIVE